MRMTPFAESYVCLDPVRAVILVPVLAGSTRHAAAALCPYSSSVTGLEVLDSVAHAGDGADNLVADDEGEL